MTFVTDFILNKDYREKEREESLIVIIKGVVPSINLSLNFNGRLLLWFHHFSHSLHELHRDIKDTILFIVLLSFEHDFV